VERQPVEMKRIGMRRIRVENRLEQRPRFRMVALTLQIKRGFQNLDVVRHGAAVYVVVYPTGRRLLDSPA